MNQNFKILYSICLTLLTTLIIKGIEIERFEHIDTRKGLSQNNVLVAYCDRYGYMWFGTMDGLNKYNGQEFIIYKSEEGRKNSLTHNRIINLWEDSLNFLWIKTYEGYCHYFIRETEEFITFPEYYNSEEEKNSYVTAFHQVNKDEIWIGTSQAGIYRLIFDDKLKRYNVTHFTSRGLTSISNDKINFIISDYKKNIYIGTNQGLNIFKNIERKTENPKIIQLYADNKFYSAIIHNDILYFSTNKNGIISYDIKKDKFIENSIYGINSNHIITFLKNLNKHFILGESKNNGLYLINIPNNQTFFYNTYGTEIRSVYIDSYNNAWIKTNQSGIFRLDLSTLSFARYQLVPDNILAVIDDERPYIYEDSKKNLWIGTHGGGLALFDRNRDQFIFYRNVPGSNKTISSNFVHCITEDKSGLLWVGTGQFNGGINKILIKSPQFDHVIIKDNVNYLAENVVRALFQDKNGLIWVATKSGHLYIYDNKFKLIRFFEKLPTNKGNLQGFNIYTIMQDHTGHIWLGSKKGGIAVSNIPLQNLNDYKKVFFYIYKNDFNDSTSLSNDNVYSIIEDSYHRIWIATYGGGINIVENRTNDKLNCKIINTINSNLLSNDIRYLYEDKEKNIWIASTFGLYKIKNKKNFNGFIKFEKFTYDPFNPNSISYNDIIHIYEDSKNSLWLGTFGGGLNLYNKNNKTFIHYRQKDGLINDAVYSIIEDKFGNIWISTEKGLSKFIPTSKHFENYDLSNGLNFENFCENTCYRLNDDRIIFGATSGIVILNPIQIKQIEFIPPIVFTKFQLFNKDVDYKEPGSPLKEPIDVAKKVVLKYNQSSFSIAYSALLFNAPEKIKYAFILENFEKNWNEVGNQTKATYTNLSPGKYIFKVRTIGNDGKFHNNVKSILLIINPPWWKTIYAYIAYIIIIISIFLYARRIFINYYRLRNDLLVERRVSEIKLKFFTDISHEIRTPLTLILGPIEDIKNEKNLPQHITEKIEIMERNARRMLRLVNQLLDFRKIQNDQMELKVRRIELIDFVEEIYKNFLPIAEHKKINYQFIKPIEPVFVWVDPKKFDSVVFNILSNAFKYTGEYKKITVEIKKDESYVDIIITDEGKGIPPEKIPLLFERFSPLSHTSSGFEGTGIGLNLSYEIMKLHHGNIFVESEVGKGSKFTIRLKQGYQHFRPDEITDETYNYKPEKEKIEETIIEAETTEDDIETEENIENKKIETTELKSPCIEEKKEKLKILLVEDNHEIIIYIKNILKEKYEVKSVPNGKLALELIENFHPDLIITDVMMPVMDGITFTKKIKENIETSHIPVIMLTAKSAVEDQIIGIESGAEAYILKPFNTQYLLSVINTILKQREIIIRKYQDKKNIFKDDIKITPKDDLFMQQIVSIIEKNYSDPEFNVEKLVELSTYSRTVLYNKLKGLTGLSPVDFLRNMRLKIAAEILEKSDRNVSETAYLVGFNDVKYFSKCFKEIYGMTPKEYKEKKNNKS